MLLFSITWGTISGWWTLACLAAGLLHAWLMYRKPVSLNRTYHYLLALARGIAVFLICFLLLSPLVKSVNYQPQKPLILIAQDNSESIARFEPSNTDNISLSVNGLAKLKETLGADYDVREFNFDGTLKPGLTKKFNGRQTNIAAAIRQLNDQFVNQNIGAVILATDGIYNQGSNPQYEAKNLKANIYTVAMGDTIPRRDLLISNVNYNKTAFLGNDFELELLTEAYMSNGETMHVTITEDGRQVYNSNTAINSNNFHKLLPVKLTADKKGLRKFTIKISPVKNEVSVENNTEVIYVEVLDARQKILLIYNSPNPDIGVIKQAVETNRNYEIKTVSVDDLAKIKLADYSLIMLHQVETSRYPQLQKFIADSKTPVWVMAGAQSIISDFNQQQKITQLAANRPDLQEVFAAPQTGFANFTLSDSTLQRIAQFPPLLAPYGSYTPNNSAAVLFKQKIGSLTTNYPLLAFADERGKRTAILTGEGLWRWGLNEYQAYGNHHALEELLSQSIQSLTANANQQRFRVYTTKNVFDEGEHVILNAELYNDALALTNTPDVKLELKEQSGKGYSYLFTRTGQSYQLDAGLLAPGDYSYNAITQLGKQQLKAQGQLSVSPLELETRQSTANHQLLANMSRQSGGAMVLPADISKLAAMIRKNENIKTVVNEDRQYKELIDMKWVFIIILALITTEWFLRKREGEI